MVAFPVSVAPSWENNKIFLKSGLHFEYRVESIALLLLLLNVFTFEIVVQAVLAKFM